MYRLLIQQFIRSRAVVAATLLILVLGLVGGFHG